MTLFQEKVPLSTAQLCRQRLEAVGLRRIGCVFMGCFFMGDPPKWMVYNGNQHE